MSTSSALPRRNERKQPIWRFPSDCWAQEKRGLSGLSITPPLCTLLPPVTGPWHSAGIPQN